MYDKSPYRNDSVHYNSEVQDILFNKILSTINKLDNTGFVLPKLDAFPEILQRLEISNLNSTMIEDAENFLKITKKNTIFSLDLYEINKLKKFSINSSNKVIALVYYSDERTSSICIEQNGNKIIKNIHHKHPKPLLTVRSIGYVNDLLSFGNISISVESNILDSTELTYNTIQNNSCQDPHVLISDILFSNIDLRECGNQLIDCLDLHDYEIKYKLWYFLKQNKNTYNESQIISLLNSLKDDYKCSAEYLYYLQKYNKKNSVSHMFYKNILTENYYLYQLIAMFFLSNVEEKIVFYKKAISICKNDFSLLLVYAETLYKASYLYEALEAINNSLKIKESDARALNLKLKILIALSNQHYSIYKNYLSEVDKIKQLLLTGEF